MSNGAMRVILSQNVGKSQEELNEAFKNENERVKNAKKFPSKSAKEHNHSK